jgi:hypothetical protein
LFSWSPSQPSPEPRDRPSPPRASVFAEAIDDSCKKSKPNPVPNGLGVLAGPLDERPASVRMCVSFFCYQYIAKKGKTLITFSWWGLALPGTKTVSPYGSTRLRRFSVRFTESPECRRLAAQHKKLCAEAGAQGNS